MRGKTFKITLETCKTIVGASLQWKLVLRDPNHAILVLHWKIKRSKPCNACTTTWKFKGQNSNIGWLIRPYFVCVRAEVREVVHRVPQGFTGN